MHAKEMILTGLALSLLAYWETDIAAIPLGLFTITYASQTDLFVGIILFKQLLAAVLLSRGLSRLSGKKQLRDYLRGIMQDHSPVRGRGN